MVAEMTEQNKILFIVTGGTILSTHAGMHVGTMPTVDVEEYLKKNILISSKISIDILRFSNIDSRLMTPVLWVNLAKAVQENIQHADYRGIIILHGTDTLEDSAFFLSLVTPQHKPVILTGAMRSADEFDTDGPRNILHAIEVILSAKPEHAGVMVVFNGQIYSPTYIYKASTHLPNSFDVSRTGHLGVIENNRVKWFHPPSPYATLPLPATLPQVDLFFVYPGFDSRLLRDYVVRDAKGVVIAGYGCGNIHDDVVPAIETLTTKSIPVVMATRVHEGSVFPVYGGAGGGVGLNQLGVIYDHDLSPFKARILLMTALAAYGKDHAKIADCFHHEN